MKKPVSIILLLFIFIVKSGLTQTPFRADLTVGANLPLSNFANQYNGGLSLEGGVFYKIPKSDINLTLTVGYNSFSYNPAYFNDLVLKNLGLTINNFTFKWKVEDIPVLAGARIKFPSGLLTPYVAGEIGVHFFSIKDRFNGDTITVSSATPPVFYFNGVETASKIGFGFAFSFGFEIEIYPKVNLDLNAKYNYSKVDITKSYTVFKNQSMQFTPPPLEKFNSFSIRGGFIIDL